jgi:3-methyladenine DNA glycosylase Mpg
LTASRKALSCSSDIALSAAGGASLALLSTTSHSHSHSHRLSQHLPQSFFARPAEQVAPELIGCLLVKHQASGELLWGVIVETEAYSQDDPACHGYRRRSPSYETLFGEPGRFYVYVSYGIHHCVKRVI